jgi:dipeptidyl aminopeptidase/acylaminoacyl peptidase
VDASADPAVTLQPRSKEFLMLLDRPNLPPISEVAAEELRLAGFRINATTYAPSRADYFNAINLQRIADTSRDQLPIHGLPEPAGPGRDSTLHIGYVRWAPDGTRFAFCIYTPMRGLELWSADVSTREARCVLPGIRLNAACGDPYIWTSDSQTIVAKFVIEDRAPPTRPRVPRGPVVQENMSTTPAPSRTFQDLLKDRHDVSLFSHYTTCQLGRVDVLASTLTPLGLPAAFRGASPSPDGRFILIDAMTQPFEYMTPASRFPRIVEVWDMKTGSLVSSVADIPLQQSIPIAFDGVGTGPRGIGWRADAPATLYWAEAQDGGDPNIEADIRDCIFTLAFPFTSAPRRLASLEWRYSGLTWGSDDVALLSERRYKTRSARSYLIAPGPEVIHDSASGDIAEALGPCCARACDLSQSDAPRRQILDVPNWENRYEDPGKVLTCQNSAGKIALRLLYSRQSSPSESNDDLSTEKLGISRPFLLMQGAGASDDGDRPFLSVFDTVSGSHQRLWQSSPPQFETILTILDEDPETGFPKTCLITRQTPKENPNFYLLDLALTKEQYMQHDESIKDVHTPAADLASRLPATTHNRSLRTITTFPHPAPELKHVQREIVYYQRADGVRLNGSLYLPPGYDAVRDGPLPVLMWAYPREFKSAEFAGQASGSPYRFVRLARTPLYWLTQGYAILDGPSMPIIGEGEEEANDTFRQQLVQSAEAAVEFLVVRGIASRDRIAIGGASYGAFMTTNLLAHAPDLFCCGIARSGAFNRTLTPFGFQAEERTIWQAPNVYRKMSPILYADRFKVPLLLIHGDADSNPGTFPLQSERMYQALKGNGKIVRYVSLPHEGHGYRARESVMHTLAEMTDWLDRYCKLDNGKSHLSPPVSTRAALK